jgi:hypothetical protein
MLHIKLSLTITGLLPCHLLHLIMLLILFLQFDQILQEFFMISNEQT